MKKVLLIGLALLLCVGIADANANRTVRMIDRPSTDPMDTTETVTSSAIDTRNFSKMSFFVDYDEAQTTAVYGTFVTEVSWDKSEWFTTKMSEFDYSAADTPDTSVVSTAHEKYITYFDVRLVAPWVRAKFTASGADAALGPDYVYVTVDFIGIE